MSGQKVVRGWVMNFLIQISLERYDRFVDRCDPATRVYAVLKNGLILRRPKGDHFERIVEIRCSIEEAKLLRDSAEQIYPGIVSEIERAMALATLNKPPGTALTFRPHQEQFVTLRDHPQMRYRGQQNWPPIWVSAGKPPIQRLTGDVGFLTNVLWHANVPTRLFLRMNVGEEPYLGSLLFPDRTFCFQLYGILRQYIGRSIKEIGDLDISFTL